ncbi:MAG: family 10 glycosylhydrolase [Candidatus Sumerlaeaceae bacterium]|nr:family 10 glycosylhydrolase [Candidatus Sumerlaeaceae bacterium]
MLAAVITVRGLASAPDAPMSPPEIRAVWASTLQPCLNSPEEIRDLVATARRAGLNTIIAQVRHRGVTWYNSDIEPRAPAIQAHPGFDPLAVLLREARDTSGGQPRIAVFAWFNVFRLGSMEVGDTSVPAYATSRYNEWVSLTTSGTRTDFLDPAIPEVQDYLIRMVDECLSRYDVDGINLDYIRYPEDDAGYHPRAIGRFRSLVGDPKATPSADNSAWNDFRRAQITAFVRRCAVTVWARRPDALMTVDATAFGGPPADGDFSRSSPYRQVMQDWAGWARDGWVDAVIRMGYKREGVPAQAKQFRDWANLSLRIQREAAGPIVTLGIGGYLNDLDGTLAQYREAQTRGLGTSLFSYWRPLRDAAETRKFGSESPLWAALGSKIYITQAPVPQPDWRRQVAVIAGTARNIEGKPLDGATVRLRAGGRPEQIGRTDGSGFYAFSRLAPGTYSIDIPDTAATPLTVEVKAGDIRLLTHDGDSRDGP